MQEKNLRCLQIFSKLHLNTWSYFGTIRLIEKYSVHWVKELLSFNHALEKKVVVSHVRMDFLQRKVNKHAGNLGSLRASDSLNEVINYWTNMLFVVRVLLNDSTDDWECFREVIFNCWVLIWLAHRHGHTTLSNWHGHWHVHWLRHGHSHWLHWHRHVIHGVRWSLTLRTRLVVRLLLLTSCITTLTHIVTIVRWAHLLLVLVGSAFVVVLVLLSSVLILSIIGSSFVCLRMFLEETLVHQKSE